MSCDRKQSRALGRRDFLKGGAAAAAVAMLGAGCNRTARPPSPTARPNFLFIICDQMNLDAMSALGCAGVRTPNLDRLAGRGVTFMESHSTNPVCSPARSSQVTGRMPVETEVFTNGRGIVPTIPNMGQWLGQAGYETVYCGKWHLPAAYPVRLPGFDVLPIGPSQGDIWDVVVARTCEAYLHNRTGSDPFLLVASFKQPHDISYWAKMRGTQMVPEDLPFASIADQLPGLPPNNGIRPRGPQAIGARRYRDYTEQQWRYYRYVYFRQIEMLDADVGIVLDALQDCGLADSTIVVFTSDHGDGSGHHDLVSKWHPYEESVKVPLIVSCPGRIAEGHTDSAHLVSGVDIMSTFCDYAGTAAPPGLVGRSLRPLFENARTKWRDFVVCEFEELGRVVRTPDYKYVWFKNDPVVQLFDIKNDPWETRNIADEAGRADVVRDHHKMLEAWDARMVYAPETPRIF